MEEGNAVTNREKKTKKPNPERMDFPMNVLLLAVNRTRIWWESDIVLLYVTVLSEAGESCRG